jgi:Ran GTPase-activating protein (RanGAP) involved in mRNA processing and transport
MDLLLNKNTFMLQGCLPNESENKIKDFVDALILFGIKRGKFIHGKTLKVNNEIGPLGMDYLSHTIYTYIRGLEIIDLSSNKCTDEGATSICNIILSQNNIKVLDLSFNKLTCKGIKYILKTLEETNNPIESLVLGYNNVYPEGADIVSSYLTSNKSLINLELTFNSLKSIGIKKISESLLKHPMIKSIDLSNNKITDEGCQYLAELLNSQKQLQKINLSGNDISDKGLEIITPNLLKMENLIELSLAKNCINNTGLGYIGLVLKEQKSIEKLNLFQNKFSSQGGLSLTEGLLNHPNIKDLYLSCNNLEDMGVKYLLGALQSTSIEQLDLSNNNLTEGSRDLAAVLISGEYQQTSRATCARE